MQTILPYDSDSPTWYGLLELFARRESCYHMTQTTTLAAVAA